MDLLYLCAMLLPKLPSMDLRDVLSIIMVFHTALLLIKRLTSQRWAMWQWAHAHGFHWSNYVPHHPEAAALTEWWNGLLKT